MKRFSLTSQFALRSLVFVVIMALALGISITWAVRQVYLREAARTARIVASSMLLGSLSDIDPNTGALKPEAKRLLDLIITTNREQADIVAIKLWNRDGVLVYSSDGVGVGRKYEDEALSEALAGEMGFEVVHPGSESDENAEEVRRNGSVVEVYAPLRVSGSGPPAGAFEIYQAYAPIARASNQLIAIVWAIIILGSIPAYLLQVSLFERTAKQLLAAEGDLQAVNRRLSESLDSLEIHSLGTLQALVAAVDAKDSYTARHSMAVTDYALAIGRRLGLPKSRIADLEQAGLLHDVGKIGTPESILLKPSKLTDEEFAIIAEHPAAGGHIVETVPFLSPLMPIVRAHHERWDGSGYPDKLRGEEIPLLARILAVADAFDAMTSERPYRAPVATEVARAEMVRCSGAQFDSMVVKALLDGLDSGEITVGSTHVSVGRQAASA